MVDQTDSDHERDLEELRYEYEDKCNELVELKNELRATKLEVQQLHLRLQASCVNTGPTVKPEPSPLAADAVEEHRASELRNLLEWIAEHIDLSSAEVLDVGFEVPVGGRAVHMQRIAQWPLGGPSSRKLRFSVPIERQDEMYALLSATKSQGFIGPSTARKLAQEWELVPGELATSSRGEGAEPAVLLAHSEGRQGMLVATWPTKSALEEFSSAVHHANGGKPNVGDRVEVEYQGDWFPGVLDSVDPSGRASVRCDVDAPGTLTIAPFGHVRRLVPETTVAPQGDTEGATQSNEDVKIGESIADSHQKEGDPE